jgi:hypothetical protein
MMTIGKKMVKRERGAGCAVAADGDATTIGGGCVCGPFPFVCGLPTLVGWRAANFQAIGWRQI